MTRSIVDTGCELLDGAVVGSADVDLDGPRRRPDRRPRLPGLHRCPPAPAWPRGRRSDGSRERRTAAPGDLRTEPPPHTRRDVCEEAVRVDHLGNRQLQPGLAPATAGVLGAATRSSGVDAELVGGAQGPGRLAEGGAGEEDHVGLAVGEDLLGLLGLGRSGRPRRWGRRPGGRRRRAGPGSRARPGSAAGALPPEETSTRSTPCSRRSAPRRVHCSRSQPPSIQSVPEIRTSRGASSGRAARMASTTSSSIRTRFSKEPP